MTVRLHTLRLFGALHVMSWPPQSGAALARSRPGMWHARWVRSPVEHAAPQPLPRFTGHTPRGLPIISEVAPSAGAEAMLAEWGRHQPRPGRASLTYWGTDNAR